MQLRDDLENAYYIEKGEPKISLVEALAPLLSELEEKEENQVAEVPGFGTLVLPEEIEEEEVVEVGESEESEGLNMDLNETEEVAAAGFNPRRVLMWGIVFAVMAVILVAWSFSLAGNLFQKNTKEKPEDTISLEKYGREISQIFKNFNLGNIINQLKAKEVENVNINTDNSVKGRVTAEGLRKISDEVVNEIKKEPVVK